MGTGHQRLELVEVDGVGFIVDRICIRPDGYEVLGSSLGFEESQCHVITGEDRGGRTELCSHIGDRGPFRHGQAGDTRTAVFDDLTYSAFDGQDPEDLEDDVLGGDPRLEGAQQFHLDHFRHGQVIGTATHGHGDVQATGANRQHADATTGRGMAVRAEQRFAGNAKALDVDLVANTIARLGKSDAVLAGNRLDVHVVVGVFETGWQGIVVDVGDGEVRFDARDIDRFELEISHRPG